MKFRVAKCVWGAAYVDTLLTLNLPTLLAPGNLPALRGESVEHVIYTTAEDKAVIERHPAYHALRQAVPSRIVTLSVRRPSGEDYPTNIARMNDAHCRILRDCEEAGAAWLFDQPDHIWGDGSLRYLVERAHAGARCVMFAGIRTILEGIGPELTAARAPSGERIALSNRDLLRLAIRHMHAHDRVRFWRTPVACTWPHHVSWRAGPTGFLRRAFFSQPFLIASPESGRMPERSVDADYVPRAFPGLKGVEFVQDSDDFLVIEASRRFHVAEYNPGPLEVPLVAAWAARNVTPDHLRFFGQPIRFHDGAVPERKWRRVERLAAGMATSVRRSRPFHHLLSAVAVERPAFATLLGRLLRDRTMHARLRLPDGCVILLPPDACIDAFLAERSQMAPAELAARVMDHILTGPAHTPVTDSRSMTTVGGRMLDIRKTAHGATIERRRILRSENRHDGILIHHIEDLIPEKSATAPASLNVL